MIRLKTKEEIEKLKIGGEKLARVLNETAKQIKPGVLTSDLNHFAHDLMIKEGGKPAFLNYTPTGAHRPYPASLCVCINDEIVHGIPNEDPQEIKEGDVVTIDAGLIYDGLYTDSAITVVAGEVSKEVQQLIENVAKKSGLSIMKGLTGHGVGYGVHEDPYVPNEGDSGIGEVIEEGLVIAIEPMFSLGGSNISLDKDGYTYKTADGAISAQFEHTVAITADGPLILTKAE
jgi:methionyl aminopeptidase